MNHRRAAHKRRVEGEAVVGTVTQHQRVALVQQTEAVGLSLRGGLRHRLRGGNTKQLRHPLHFFTAVAAENIGFISGVLQRGYFRGSVGADRIAQPEPGEHHAVAAELGVVRGGDWCRHRGLAFPPAGAAQGPHTLGRAQ